VVMQTSLFQMRITLIVNCWADDFFENVNVSKYRNSNDYFLSYLTLCNKVNREYAQDIIGGFGSYD